MRRFLGILATVLLLAAAGWTGWWFWVASRTERLAAEWIDQRRATGDLVEHAGIRTEGFPLTVRLHVAQPKLGRAGAGWTWLWTGPAMEAEAPAWGLDRLTFRAHGTQTVTGEVGRDPRPLRAEVSGVFGTLGREDDRWVLRAHGYDLHVAERGRPAQAVRAAAANLIVGYPGETGRLRMTVDIDTVTLPEAGLLGDTIAHAGIDAETVVPLPRDESAAALARWRDAGGTVDIARLNVGYGAATLEANGRLGLDAELRPAGDIGGRLRGWTALFDALVKRGDIPQKNATTARMLVGLMAKPGADGQSELEARFTLADGQLRLGPFALAPLEPLAR